MTDPYAARLTQAGKALRLARENVSAAMLEASNVAHDAVDAGMTEVQIAKWLGVSRNTVRGWLGKPRSRPMSLSRYCPHSKCGYWAVDSDDMREHVARNH